MVAGDVEVWSYMIYTPEVLRADAKCRCQLGLFLDISAQLLVQVHKDREETVNLMHAWNPMVRFYIFNQHRH